VNWTDNLGVTPSPKVLVACPTYAGCAYSLREWSEAYHAFTYKNKGALQVDNSDDNLHYSHLVRAQGIPCIYAPTRFNFLWDTLELSWRRIVEYAHDNDYDLIASIEADIICPPETLDVLVQNYLEKGPKAVVAHRYHPRGVDPSPTMPDTPSNPRQEQLRKDFWFDTLGCVLFPTSLLYDSRDMWRAIVEVELYLLASDQGYERVRLKDELNILHYDDPNRGTKSAFPMPLKNVSDRLAPAVMDVKRPIPRGEAAAAPRTILDLPHGSPVDGLERNRPDVSTPTVEAPDTTIHGEAAQEARDTLKWDAIDRGVIAGKTLEEQNASLRLMCGTLFAENERLKGEDRRDRSEDSWISGEDVAEVTIRHIPIGDHNENGEVTGYFPVEVPKGELGAR